LSISRKKPSAASNLQQLTANNFFNKSQQSFRVLRLTFPYNDAVPAKFLERGLMELVAGDVAVELRQPPLPTVRWRGAVPATAMSMPKAAVNEDGGFVFQQNDVGTAGEFSDVQPKAVAHPMKQ
jgi:hypothetical protein